MADQRKSYAELLKDPRWQRKRLEILTRDDWTCQSCADKETTLHVHHRYYVRGRLPWQYDADCLVTLCEACHQAIEVERGMLMESIRGLREGNYEVVRGFVDAVIAATNSDIAKVSQNPDGSISINKHEPAIVAAESHAHAWGIGCLIGLDPDRVLELGRFDMRPHLEAHQESLNERRRRRLRGEVD